MRCYHTLFSQCNALHCSDDAFLSDNEVRLDTIVAGHCCCRRCLGWVILWAIEYMCTIIYLYIHVLVCCENDLHTIMFCLCYLYM